MGKRGRRIRKAQRAKHTNMHHLLFQRKHFADGYGFLLRQAFVFEMDVEAHNELHRHILHDVPKPPEIQLRKAWEAYQKDKWLIDQYDIIQATEWLLRACEDPAWKACMSRQLIYFKDIYKGF